MSFPEVDDLAFKAEVQKKVLSNCISNLHKYFRSRKWEQLANKFRSLGYELPKDLISCKICEDDSSGFYFYKQKKIILCANNIIDSDFDDNLTQHMIKSFDDARAEIDPSNPMHIACSLIRGANLSGKCNNRSQFRLFMDKGNYARCVRELAVTDFLRYKSFGFDKEKAEDVVFGVWDTCFYDYEPYTTEEFRKSHK